MTEWPEREEEDDNDYDDDEKVNALVWGAMGVLRVRACFLFWFQIRVFILYSPVF